MMEHIAEIVLLASTNQSMDAACATAPSVLQFADRMKI